MTAQKPDPRATTPDEVTGAKDSNLQVEQASALPGWRRHITVYVLIGLGLIAVATLGLLLLNRDSLPFKLPPGGEKSDYLLVGTANQDGEDNLYLLRLGQKLEEGILLAEKTTLPAGSFSIENGQEALPLTGLVYPYGGFIPETNTLLYWFNQSGKLFLNQLSTDQIVPVNLFSGATPYIWGTLLNNHSDIFLVETPSANQVRCHLSQNGEPARQLLEGETCILTGNQSSAYANRMDGDRFTLSTANLSNNAVYTPLQGQSNVGLFSVSPDGSRIAYEKVGQPSEIILVNATNGQEITSSGPFNDVLELNFAQNADVAYFIDENEAGELELHLLDDQGARFITSSQTLGALLNQDGKALVYRTGPVDGEQTLFARNISNDKDVEILSGYNLGYTIIDSLKRILISDSSTEFTFYSSNLDGSDISALYNQPGMSLDKILTTPGEPYVFLFLRNADGLISGYAYNVNTANVLILADEMENLSLLDISPDGKEALFSGQQKGKKYAALFLASLEKEAPYVLDQNASSISNAIFTSDGDQVVYTAVTGDSSNEVEIRLVDLRNEKQPEVIYGAAFLVNSQWKNLDAFQSLYLSGGSATSVACPGAEALSIGKTVHHSLSTGKPDCFRIKVSAGESATFSAQAEDRLELSLALYDRKGDSIEPEKSWQAGNNPNMLVAFPADGIYYLQVSSLDGSGGPYSLFSSVGVDICLGAVDIKPGDKLSGKAPSNGSATYRFYGQAEKSYTFWLQDTANTTGITFYNSEGDAIERNPNQGVYNIFIPSEGNYCLSVSDIGAGDETFTIGMLEGWVYCPSAPELSLDTSVSGKISREAQSCYSFRADADKLYSLSVNSPDDTDTTIELYDSQGNLLASDDDSGRGYNPSLSFSFSQSGTYYAMVNGMFPDASGNFELTLVEGISACSNPQTLEVGNTVHRKLQEGEKDCYSFEATSGEGLDFYVESDILTVLRLYDQTGQEIASVGDTGENFTPHLVAIIPEDGTYFFTISILGKTGSGEYNLRMESLRASESCIQGTQQVAIGNVIDGSFLPDEQSCYSLAASSGERVLLWVEAEIDTQLILYLPSGVELTRDDDSGGDVNPRLVTTLPEDGIYTIAVEGYGPTSGAFTLHIETSSPGTDAFALAIELPWNTRTSGAITSGSYIYLDEFRYGTHGVIYTFLGGEGDKIQIDVLAGSIDSLLDPVFHLFNAEHTSLTTDDDSGTGYDSRIIYTLPYTGQYYILVEDIHDRYGDAASYYFEILLRH